MDTILSVRNLTKYKKNGFLSFRQNRKAILDSIYLNIYENEIVGLLGESLSGKSSLGKSILKLIPIDDGKILYKNQDITNFNKKKMVKIREEMQILFQHSEKFINPRVTIYEIVTEPLIGKKLSKDQIKMKISELFFKLDISKDCLNKLPSELLSEELEKIMLARVLILNPKFLVVDDLTAGLSSKNRYRILSLLKRVQKESEISILFISNDSRVILSVSDRVAIIYKGQIVEVLKSKDFLNNPLHPYTKILSESIKVIDYDNKKNIHTNNRCKFLNRCGVSKDICHKDIPKLKEYEDNHYVSCFLYEE